MNDQYDFYASAPNPYLGKVFPPELFASDEFGDFTLICSYQQYQQEIQNCIESGFSADFDPEPRVWTLVEGNLYETIRCDTANGKNRVVTEQALMTWMPGMGTYKAEYL